MIHAESLVAAAAPDHDCHTIIMVADDDDNPVTSVVARVSGSTFWHFGHGLAAEPLLHKLRKEVGEWH